MDVVVYRFVLNYVDCTNRLCKLLHFFLQIQYHVLRRVLPLLPRWIVLDLILDAFAQVNTSTIMLLHKA